LTTADRPPTEALRMVGVVKTFGANRANDGIDLSVAAGEVHAILGENGAGKSTLVKILCGIYQPDQGQIYVDGRRVRITSPLQAAAEGIAVVHQRFMLIPSMTVLDNVILGRAPVTRWQLIDTGGARERLVRLAEDYDFDVDPDARVSQLSVGARQRVEILRAMYHGARILVLDEPTAVLTPSESRKLLTLVRSLTGQGNSAVFISHKLNEVREVASRVTVLRAGKVAGVTDTGRATEAELAAMMIGRDLIFERKEAPREGQEPVLTLDRVSCAGDTTASALKDVSLQVRRGEIVGVAGVDGNGQRELAECIAGLRPYDGLIDVNGDKPGDALHDPMRLGFMPEDRHEQGLVGDFSVAENLVLRWHTREPFCRTGWLRWSTIRGHAEEQIARYDIRCPGPDAPVKHLSGGNQQKVIVARETSPGPDVLVAAHPTRGLDVGAVDAVLDDLRAARAAGTSVLLISTELPELLVVCDRIVVMHRGEIMGEVPPTGDHIDEIGAMMMGRRGRAADVVGS
jgi:general nucleoside transport system ATP-binding protein